MTRRRQKHVLVPTKPLQTGPDTEQAVRRASLGNLPGGEVGTPNSGGTGWGWCGDTGNMRIELACQPSYTLAYCHLSVNEGIFLERDAMVAMSAGIRVETATGPGSFFQAVKRKAMGGEGFLMGRYVAEYEGAWVACAPRYPGDVAAHRVDPHHPGLVVEQGSLLASSVGLDIDVRWAGMSNMLLREGLSMMHVEGDGHVLLSTYGGLQRFTLEERETITVDSGHLVAYHDTVSLNAGPLGGIAVSATTGEGMVAQLEGPGDVWVQTRAEQGIKSWLFPERHQNER